MILLTILIIVMILLFTGFATIRNWIPVKETENSSGFNSYEYNSYDEFEIWLKILSLKPFITGGYFAIVILIGFLTSIYNTSEKEIGFTSVFGKNTIIDSAGIHFKIPFVSQKFIYDATTKGMAIGYSEDTDESIETDSLMITSDFNFVNIDFYLEYRIVDPIAYHYSTDNPEGILNNISQSAIRNNVGQHNIDGVMTTEKVQIETSVFEDIQKELASSNTGLEIQNITIQDSEPPTSEVAQAFKAVEDAKQNADTAVNEANAYTNTQIPAAEAKAEEIKQNAEATKTVRINEAKEEVASFEALFTEYASNPKTVKEKLYLDAMSEILPNMEIIIAEDGQVIYINGDTQVTQKASE